MSEHTDTTRKPLPFSTLDGAWHDFDSFVERRDKALEGDSLELREALVLLAPLDKRTFFAGAGAALMLLRDGKDYASLVSEIDSVWPP